MSRDDIAKQLRGTTNDVQNAAKEIQTRFEQIRKGATASVASYALHYEVGILRQLCCALQDNYHKHAELYCDIATALLPHVAPCPGKPEFWVSHLNSLQYIHHALCRETTISSCQRFYTLITSQRVQLQSKGDYKFYLNMHIKHLYYFAQQRQPSSPGAKQQLCLVLQSLGALFHELQPPQSELMSELNLMLGKRSASFLKTLGTLPLEYNNKMYEPLFRFISGNAGTAEELTTQFPEYLSAFHALLQLDSYAWPQLMATQTPPLALQLLRSCRELYKEQQGKNYAMQLLYYYLKLLYTTDPSCEVKRPYVDLVKKLMHFFEHKAAAYAQEPWLVDFLHLFVRLQRQLHQVDNKSPAFDIFWQGLDTWEPFGAHFELLQCLISNSMKITSSSSSLSASCSNDPQCQSLRKHYIFTLGHCALISYRNWQTGAKEMLSKNSLACLVGIIQYAMDVLRVTKCMSSSSVEVINFVWHLTNIADKVSNAGQMLLLQQLLKPLQQLRPLIGVQELRQLLRRLYKASAHSEDRELSAQLQCTYIVSIASSARQFEQMCVFYCNPKSNASKCIYALHEASPLCNPLTAAQQRQLYERDMLALLSNKKTPALLQSLLQHRHTDYHLTLLGRHLRTDKKVLQHYEELRVRLRGSSGKLSRLQQLLLAHASVTKLVDCLEARKIKIPIKEMGEKTLEEMLIKHNLLHVNLASELPLLQLATDAIDAFEQFYKRADAEPLASDEALIDWEALIDDAIVAAMALSTMGYMAQADHAWLLLLRMSRWLGDRFTYLRALNHFLWRYTQHAQVELNKECAHAEQLLDELWPQLVSGAQWMFKRQHTTLLVCLCHMALYKARQNCMSHAQLLLLHVQHLREQFPERVGKADIIQLTLLCVRFRLGYQKRQCTKLAMPTTALQQLDKLTESVRQFAPISSQDNGLLVLLLSDLVQDITECTANRLCKQPNLSSSLLQVLLQSGLVLRAVEVLISWLWTNLRMECLDKAQSKLRLIEHFLCVESLQLSAVSRASSPSLLAHAPTMDAQSKHMSDLVGKMLSMQLEPVGAISSCVEPIRKQQQQQQQWQQLQQKLLSPRPAEPASALRAPLQLQRYVQPAGHALLSDSLQLQCIYFVVGLLHARLYFLNREHEQLDEFYALSNDWLKSQPERGQTLGNMLLLLQQYQANYLRARRKYRKAMELSEQALQLAGSDPLQQQLDVNYRFNLLLQLRTAKLELQPQPVKEKLRRALKFNMSPMSKPSKATSALVQSSKASKGSTSSTKITARRPAKFAIYTEDASVLSASSGSGSSPEEGERLDLNSCQIIQIIDLSDEEPPVPAAQLKLTKSARRPKTPTSTKTRTQKQVLAAETPAGRGRARAGELLAPTSIISTPATTGRARGGAGVVATPATTGRARGGAGLVAPMPTTTTPATTGRARGSGGEGVVAAMLTTPATTGRARRKVIAPTSATTTTPAETTVARTRGRTQRQAATRSREQSPVPSIEPVSSRRRQRN